MRSAQSVAGSLAWQSADTMKYLLGAPGRAVRVQPAWPGVSRRQRLGSLTTMSLPTTVLMQASRGCADSCRRPVDERVGGRALLVMLEGGLDGGADPHVLPGVAEKVADHADAAGVGQFHEDDHVGAGILEGRMDGMPSPLPAIDDAPALDALPADVERATSVADPLRPPLPPAAATASLDPELPAARPVPVRPAQAVGFRDRAR